MSEMDTTEQSSKRIKRRGFGSMSRDKHRAIASAGGKMAHAKGVAHTFSSEEARAAGIKGGLTVSRDQAHMKAIGRLGGLAKKRSI